MQQCEKLTERQITKEKPSEPEGINVKRKLAWSVPYMIYCCDRWGRLVAVMQLLIDLSMRTCWILSNIIIRLEFFSLLVTNIQSSRCCTMSISLVWIFRFASEKQTKNTKLKTEGTVNYKWPTNSACFKLIKIHRKKCLIAMLHFSIAAQLIRT